MAVVMSNVDDKLVAGTNVNVAPVEVVEPVSDEVKEDVEKVSDAKVEDASPYGVNEEKVAEREAAPENKDEYGVETPKTKTYSEEEVNRIVRDRLKRTQEERRVEPQKQEVAKEGEENWEQQLEGFVEKTIHKISEKEQVNIRQAKERESLSKLEGNIHQSMTRYRDFQDVVGKAQITDTMVKATKNFKDPGAFLYAASKMQAKELERIARLDDPLDQAAEIGKLEERMRKLKGASNSPRPMTDVKGDIANRENVRPNVDELIRKDQLKKFQRR